MIQVKHFQSERDERKPEWKDVETYLNQFDLGELAPVGAPNRPRAQILQMKAYPTGTKHNIVLVMSVTEKP